MPPTSKLVQGGPQASFLSDTISDFENGSLDTTVSSIFSEHYPTDNWCNDYAELLQSFISNFKYRLVLWNNFEEIETIIASLLSNIYPTSKVKIMNCLLKTNVSNISYHLAKFSLTEEERNMYLGMALINDNVPAVGYLMKDGL